MSWWMWTSLGLVLLVLEVVTPSGFFILFFGLGALTIGVLLMLGPVPPAWAQWLLFPALSLAYLLIFRRKLASWVHTPSGDPVDSLVGALAVPQERILPGHVGRVEVRGSAWSARNDTPDPIEPGVRARVVRIDGLLLGIRPE